MHDGDPAGSWETEFGCCLSPIIHRRGKIPWKCPGGMVRPVPLGADRSVGDECVVCIRSVCPVQIWLSFFLLLLFFHLRTNWIGKAWENQAIWASGSQSGIIRRCCGEFGTFGSNSIYIYKYKGIFRIYTSIFKYVSYSGPE